MRSDERWVRWGAVALVVLLLSVGWWRRRATPSGGTAPETSLDGASGPPVSRNARAGRTVRAPRSSWVAPTPLRASPGTSRADPQAFHGSLRGHVVSAADGSPVPGAMLTFVYEGATSLLASDPLGAFDLRPMSEGTYVLASVTAEGFHPFVPPWGASPVQWTARGAQVTDDVVLQLVPRVAYAVSVRDERGAPVEGASVRCLDADAESAATDARGEAVLHPVDDVVIEATHAGYAPSRTRADVSSQLVHRVELVLRAGESVAPTRLRGRVLDPRGEGVDGALVRARCELAEGTAAAEVSPRWRVETSADGRFVLEPVDRCPWVLDVSAEGLSPTRMRVGVERAEVTVRLGTESRVRGRVTDAVTGRPVPSFTVVVSAHFGLLELGPARAVTVFDPDGRYELGGLGAGLHEVTAYAVGYAPAPDARVLLPPGGVGTADLPLPRGATVTGRVVSAGGRAVSGARVSLEGRLGGADTPVPLAQGARTGDDGRFTLGGVSPGGRSLFVAAEGHHARVVSGLAAVEGATVDTGDVELAPVAGGDTPHIELAGVGAVLAARGDLLVVGQVLPDGGAAAAGIAPGDEISAVDGVGVAGLGFEGSVQRIRGPVGSTVDLRVRTGDAGVRTVTVTRRRVLR